MLSQPQVVTRICHQSDHQEPPSRSWKPLKIGLVAILAVVVLRVFDVAHTVVKAREIGNTTAELVSKINQTFNGDYTDLTAEYLNKAGLVKAPFSTTGTGTATQLRDGFGNPVEINGTTGSYALAFTALTRDFCTCLAPELHNIANVVRVGEITAGTAAGTVVAATATFLTYKDATTPVNKTAIHKGCDATDPKIAIQVGG